MNNFKLINETNSPENLVVFIHGFTGTDDTWEKKGGQYPLIENILESTIIFQNYNIAVFKYASKRILNEKPTSINKRFGTELLKQTPLIKKLFNADIQYNQPVPVITDILTSHIKTYTATKKINQLNIYLVAHSMGGLVSKKFILDNLTHSVFNVVQFHSIHVPHSGSEFAGILNNKVNNIQAKDLETNSDLIHELNLSWLKSTEKGLPFTYYYTGHSDLTVNKNSAKSYELRDKNVEFLGFDLRHSNFLDFVDDNPVLDWIKIGLEKSWEESASKNKAKIIQDLDNLKRDVILLEKDVSDRSDIIEELYDNVEKTYPECKTFTCFRHQKVSLFESVYLYTNDMSDTLSNNRAAFFDEIEYIFDMITAFLVKDVPVDFENMTFTYKTVYCHIFNYINKNFLGNCSCPTREKFLTLILTLEKADKV